MNISKFDVGLLFILSLAIVLISFTGPVFGLTDDKATNETDIPELDVNNGTFDRLDGFPEEPGNPSGGTLVYVQNETSVSFGSENQVFVTGGTEGGADGVELFAFAPIEQNTSRIGLMDVNTWKNGGVQPVHTETFNFSREGQEFKYYNDSDGLGVALEVVDVNETYNTTSGYNDTRVAVEYEVTQTPSDTGVFSDIPIVGGIVSGASDLASIVGWIGSIIFYLFLIAGETAINTFVILTNVMTYIIDLLSWMTGTYLGVVDSAPGWSRVIVAVPGVLFGAVLGKFVAVGVSLLPTT